MNRRPDLSSRLGLNCSLVALFWGMMIWLNRGCTWGKSESPSVLEWSGMLGVVLIVAVGTCTEWLAERIDERLRSIEHRLEARRESS